MALSYDNLSGTDGGQPPPGNTANLRDASVQRVDLEATLPPTPVRELLAASGATFYVLATEPTLVATIRRAAADRYPLVVVERWSDLKEAAESGRCGIALLDAAVLGSRVGECVATLAVHGDRLVTLVAADRAAAHEYVGLLSDGRVHRLLMKPAAVGATRLLIESATARRLQLREEAANDDARHGAAAGTRSFAKWGWAAAAVLVAVALLGTGVVANRLGWLDGGAAANSGAAAAAPVAASTIEERIADHHAKAALARQEGRLIEPPGDNALDHYLTILALVPADQAARNGIAFVQNTLFTGAEEALLAGALDGAAAALDQVRRIDPASSRLAFLDAQLARALAAVPAPQPAPAAARAPSEIDSVLNLATARLRRGQLLAPPGDSASEYLDRATELNPNDPRVALLRTDLAAALLAAARMLADADVAAATNLATEARRLGADPAALAAFERDVGVVRARENQRRLTDRLEAANQRVRSGALFEPADDSALAQLASLQADAPNLAGLGAAWDGFVRAGAAAIQIAIERHEWDAADAQLARLAQAPGGATAAAPLSAELAARRLQEAYLAAAAPASEVGLLSSVPAVYPEEAIERNVEGWVDLEFVVDRNGQPRDLEVVQALPPGRFDEAALTAVERYRYAPFERDGRIYERRVRLRVRFEIE
jgi:TonB family protein